MGEGTLQEIVDALGEHGLRLGGDAAVVGERISSRMVEPRAGTTDGAAFSDDVGVLNLGVRASNCLRLIGVRTIQDLVEWSAHDLAKTRNLGRQTLAEIIERLKEHRLSLRTDSGERRSVPPERDSVTVLARSVDALELGTRAKNRLRIVGVRTVQDLIMYSERQILNVLGRRTLEEIIERLKDHKLSLRTQNRESRSVPAERDSVPVLERGVDALKLGTRATNCLRNAGVRTVRDLIIYSEQQLLDVPHLGSGTAKIVDALAGLGLQLHDPHDPFRQTLRVGLETADEELEYVVSELVSPRNRNAVMLRLGWSGQPVCTLEELAGNPELSGLGNRVTRERVRQIEVKAKQAIRKRLDGLCPRRVSDALRLVSKSTPVVADEVPTLLKQHGLSRTGLSYSGLSTIAELTEAGWSVVELIKGPNPVLVSTDEQSDYEVALKLIGRSRSEPFSCVTDIVGAIPQLSRMAVLVTRLVDVHSGYRWLDRDAGLFWNAGRDSNKILYQCKKVFSLADRVLLDDMHAAVRRTRTVVKMPPKHALLEMLRQTDWIEIRGNHVELRAGVDSNPLSMEDRRLVRATRGMGRTVGFSEIRDNLVREGVSASHAGQHLLFSPFLVRVARGRFRLLFDPEGAKAYATRAQEGGAAGAVGGLLKEADPTTAWSARVQITSRVMITDRMPIEKKVPGGRWDVVHDGEHVGHCDVDGGYVRRLAAALRQRGAKAGDHCRLRFDRNKRSVQIEIEASDRGCSST